MHILFLTDNFPPEVNAPASRTYEHCREWVRAGEKVTVITCAPNFPKGKVFEGYKNKLWQKEELDGIEVIRVWSYITANEGFIKRILDYISFMLSAVVASFFVRKVDVVVGTSPQFFTAVAAYLAALFKRVPWVFELRDIWPESIRAVGAMKESRLLDWLEKLELFLYRKASLIVSVTNSFKQSLVARGVDPEKIVVVTNGVDLTRFSLQSKNENLLDRYALRDKFVAGYIGTHGMAHALETLLDAAKLLEERGESDICILLLGDGAHKSRLKQIAAEKRLSNVLFLDSVPKDEVALYWSLLDVSIIHLKKTDLFKTVIPSKIFECMGMGIPLLHGVEGESAEIVESERVGLLFEPENPEELVSGLVRLKSDNESYSLYRINCLEAAGKFDRQYLAERMLEHVRSTVSN